MNTPKGQVPEALQPCPCGATPTALQFTGDEQAKWAHVSGDCCGEWEIEYRNNYAKIASAEAMALATKAWNEAVRAQPAATPSGELTENEWLQLADRHSMSDWNCDKQMGYLHAVKALCTDFASIRASHGQAPAGSAEWAYSEIEARIQELMVGTAHSESMSVAQAGAVQLERFLDAAASEGLVLDGIDAADLYVLLFPELYAQGMEGVPIKEGGQHGADT